MGVHQPKKYTIEFKQRAVELSKELGSAPKAAEQLGVSEANIYSWRQKFGKAENASITESEAEELSRLRKEVQLLKKTNYILKQAAAFFSQDHLK